MLFRSGLLGVREPLIVADYAASAEQLERIVGRLLSASGYESVLETLPADTLHAEPATMASFLAGVRERYGSSAVTRAVLVGRSPGVAMPLLPD